MDKKRSVRIVGAVAGAVLALGVAGGAYATVGASHGQEHAQKAAEKGAATSTAFRYTVGDAKHPVAARGVTPKGHASTITVRLDKNPHNTMALLEGTDGTDLGKPKTVHSGASSVRLAEHVPAGTHYRLILAPTSQHSPHYGVQGVVRAAD